MSTTNNIVCSKSEANKNWEEEAFIKFNKALNTDDNQQHRHELQMCQGYLLETYTAAGDNVEDKKGIAGFMAFVLVQINDYKNAEIWAKKEFKINPNDVWAKLAQYWINLTKLANHSGFSPSFSGSWEDIFTEIVLVGFDSMRVGGKVWTLKNSAKEAARSIVLRAEDGITGYGYILMWCYLLLDIVDNLWENNLKELYLCDAILNISWEILPGSEDGVLKEYIKEVRTLARSYLARAK